MENKGIITIMGGDFNATWDGQDVDDNIDILNMTNIPSKFRSDKFNWVANNNELTDPYRYLNPSKRDFTYIPNARQHFNRSRIDFFLVTTSLCGKYINCDIEQTLTTSAFDHKMVSLDFSRGGKKVHNNTIKNQMLSDPLFTSKIRATVLECHLQHVDPDVFPPFRKRELLETIGMVHNKINLVNSLRNNNYYDNQGIGHQISGLLMEIEEIFETLPDHEFFEGLEKNCEKDHFFEVLVMNLKNNALAQQKKIYDAKNRSKMILSNKLRELKKDFIRNKYEILELEQKMVALNEKEIREELENMYIFDRLTNEKMTPYFLNLAKKGQKTDSTLTIRSDNGEEFTDPKSNHTYISDTYKKLYKKPDSHKDVTLGDIEDFLGDCRGIPEVENSKLSDIEKNIMDRDIGIHELDTAINQSKKRARPVLTVSIILL
jgi:hypothetical protein